ncbi:MAG TPA: quinoprotein dehydrogenase-associated SoxYZ-like carrier [Burkholderiales bacterium]|nr:quinoprotein dehydrogenase-associated SoxYZ-like carrier [Burkholderiales bacterium]
MDGMRCGRRNWCGKWLLGLFCALTALAAQAAEAVPDTDIWLKVRESFFGARPIRNDADGVIRLEAPYRAQDAATVPVAIRAGIAQTSERYIRTVYLIVDRNPSPIAAIFHFTPDSGRAEIETRIRIEEYTPVRAIAEMSDGELYGSAKFVKAAGGCSAPAGKDPEAALARLGRMKFHLDQSVVLGEPNLAQLMISHPNHSGLAMDQMTHLYVPAYFVRTINVSYAGRPVLSAEVDFSISENPNFRFYFVPREEGELKAEVVDTKDLKFEYLLAVRRGLSTKIAQ